MQHRHERNTPVLATFLAVGLLVTLLGGCGAPPSRSGGGGGGSASDRDGDGLTDAEERILGTDPGLADTDGDGLSDGAEVLAGTSPLARDSDGDGLEDGEDPEPTIPATSDDDQQEPGDDIEDSDTNGQDEPPESDDGSVAEAEPNDGFDSATAADVGEEDTLALTGSIDSRDDIDVFDLGAFSAGDRITVQVARTNRFLDALVAVFDREGNLLARSEALSELSPDDEFDLDQVVGHQSDSYFLAVTFSTVFVGVDDYAIEVRVERGGEVPVGAGQVVFLDFDGGDAWDPSLEATIELDPFDAADIDPMYEGQTGVVKSNIMDTILENYRDLNLTVLHSDVDEPPEGFHSTIYFGGFSRLAFGVADGVDSYNRNPADNAIVYTGAFTPDRFVGPVSAEELGLAIGNVASHQLGHLLGLDHVDDAGAVMASSAAPDALLEDQDFITADLNSEVFPLGGQDSRTLLAEILGPL